MSNPFSGWSPQQVAEHNAKVRSASGTPVTIQRDHEWTVPLPNSVRAEMNLKTMTDEQKLNKTEKEFLVVLRTQLKAGQIQWIGIQNITIKIGDDCRFTPDFWAIRDGLMKAYDVKAAWKGKVHVEDDAKVKIQVAARTFPMFEFITCWKHDGMWNYKIAKP